MDIPDLSKATYKLGMLFKLTKHQTENLHAAKQLGIRLNMDYDVKRHLARNSMGPIKILSRDFLTSQDIDCCSTTTVLSPLVYVTQIYNFLFTLRGRLGISGGT